jgi:hypothetical protein
MQPKKVGHASCVWFITFVAIGRINSIAHFALRFFAVQGTWLLSRKGLQDLNQGRARGRRVQLALQFQWLAFVHRLASCTL